MSYIHYSLLIVFDSYGIKGGSGGLEGVKRMIPYSNTTFGNYNEIRDLGITVSRIILDRKVPEPGQISQIFGEESVDSYIVMHALTHSKEYGRRKGIINYGRRDQKAMQIHPYDSAFKPYRRLRDPRLPSGYDLTPKEIREVLIHDLGEEFGHSPIGALVVNAILGYLLGKDSGEAGNRLTNQNGLVLDSLQKKVYDLPQEGLDRIQDKVNDLIQKGFNHGDIDDFLKEEMKELYQNHTYNVLKEEMRIVEVKASHIKAHYRKFLNALNNFEAYVGKNSDYMDKEQKEDLLGRIRKMSNNLKGTQGIDILTPNDAAQSIFEQYKHVMKIMEAGNYIEVDENLVVPGSTPFLLTLEKTLYRDYTDNLGESMLPKDADSTDNVIKMDHTSLLNDTSIFRKARILINSNIKRGRYLKENNEEYKRLERGADYLFRNLDASVNHHLRELQKRTKDLSDEHWTPDLEMFKLMKEKLDESKKEFSEVRKQHKGEMIKDAVNDIIRVRIPKLNMIYF